MKLDDLIPSAARRSHRERITSPKRTGRRALSRRSDHEVIRAVAESRWLAGLVRWREQNLYVGNMGYSMSTGPTQHQPSGAVRCGAVRCCVGTGTQLKSSVDGPVCLKRKAATARGPDSFLHRPGTRDLEAPAPETRAVRHEGADGPGAPNTTKHPSWLCGWQPCKVSQHCWMEAVEDVHCDLVIARAKRSNRQALASWIR